MKKYILFMALFFTFSCAGGSVKKEKLEKKLSDEELIQKTYRSYINCLSEKKGYDTLALVSQRTIDYYGKCIKDSLYLGCKKTKELSLMKKIIVLRIRSSVDLPILKNMTGKKLFVYGVNRGWVGEKEKIERLKISRIFVEGNAAETRMSINGTEFPFGFNFYKEDGSWKIDITSLMGKINTILEKRIKNSGQDVNDYVLTVMKMVTKKELTENIWSPLIK